MSRINTNVQSLVAQRVLGQNNFQLNQSLERLSTGLRISRGKDDPAGLIASENLRAELGSINAAISNAERADQVVNIAEGGLQEISGLLVELQGLITGSANDAGLSTEEKEANQLQIDSILQTIDRISAATSFQGIKLLNGNFDYNVSGVDSGITDFKVNGAKFGGSSLDVDVVVTQSAQQGALYLSLGGTSLNLQGNGAANSAFTIEINGALGSRELSFASGTTLANIATTINNFTDVTGITASANGAGIALQTESFGSNEFVSVKIVNDAGIGTATSLGIYGFETGDGSTVDTASHDDFDSTAASNAVRDIGQDLAGTVNGIVATSSGKTLRINTDFLDASVTLATAEAQAVGSVGGANPSLTITGGGADFQLSGKVNIAGKVSLGIKDTSIRKLGNSTLGYLDDLVSGQAYSVVDGDLTAAQKVVDEAIAQVSGVRGRLGAFQRNTVGATVRSLGIAVENTAAAESTIRDADFAAETAALTRSQILVSAATNILGLANAQPQSALQLLG